MTCEVKDDGEEKNLLRELRALISRKPPEGSPPSIEDEFHLKTHSIYFEIIARHPVFAVQQKLELEMWNNLYKTPIDVIQNALRRRATNGTTPGHPRSMMELKLRFGLLLDRASGVYLSLIYRLLLSIQDSSWPKSLLGTVSSLACPGGFFHLNHSGRTTGRFDLDLATFCALNQFTKIGFVDLHTGWFRLRSDDFVGHDTLSSTTPRILSRGDRLPTESMTESREQTSCVNSDASPLEQTRHGMNKSDANPTLGLNCHQLDNDNLGTCPDRISAVTYIVQHCLVHLGDVARYRQHSNVAASYYLWAWAVHPDSGHPYNQLAILESSKPASARRLDVLFYYYVRASSCLYPFPVARNNLKASLRAHMGTLYAAATAGSSESGARTSGELHSMLMFLFASIELGLDPLRLVPFLRDIAQLLHIGTRPPTDDQWIHYLVIVHIYLLDECLNKLFKLHTDSNAVATLVDLSDKQSLILLTLLQLMIHFMDWLAGDCTSRQMSCTTTTGFPTSNASLIGLMLWFLWLREQAITEHSSFLNELLNKYIPSLPESVIQLLNSVHVEQKTATESALATDSHGAAGDQHFGSANAIQDHNPSLPWSNLIQLPELLMLQGFQPLNIPTQYQLGLTPSTGLHCPLFPSSFSSSTQVCWVSRTTTQMDVSSSAHMLALHNLRITCFRQSACIVAREFTSLIQVVKTPCSTENHMEFGFVRRSSDELSWMDQVLKSVERNKNELTTSEPPCTLASNINSSTPLVGHKILLGVSELGSNRSSSTSIGNGSNSSNTDNLGLTATRADDATQSSTQSTTSSTVDSTLKGAVAVETSPLDTETRIVPPNTTPSGGLIVNAELAKFIQEQASQVAARQQRKGFSNVAQTSDVVRDVNSSSRDSVHKSASTGTFRSPSAKVTASSRLCLSAAFRRDLPPRFAKRLQAELLECEARDSCPVEFDTNRPAPLARKESEAPYDLNSLLSISDRIGPNPISQSAQNSVTQSLTFIGPGSTLDVEPSNDLIRTTPNHVPSLSIPSHYLLPPLNPSFTVPPMVSPATRIAPFVPGSHPLFSGSIQLTSRESIPLSDWETNRPGIDVQGVQEDYIARGGSLDIHPQTSATNTATGLMGFHGYPPHALPQLGHTLGQPSMPRPEEYEPHRFQPTCFPTGHLLGNPPNSHTFSDISESSMTSPAYESRVASLHPHLEQTSSTDYPAVS